MQHLGIRGREKLKENSDYCSTMIIIPGLIFSNEIQVKGGQWHSYMAVEQVEDNH